jgi:UDP-2,4-diacetamido-2,4,6-trideoxy-beta-L-altropyranose hydrolase
VNETLALARECGANWVVLDGYHFNATYQRQVRQAGHELLVVDDYAHLPNYDSDILLNQNIGANDLAYNLPPYTRTLFGLPFVMLRRDFYHAREPRKPVREKARRVLVTLGGGDEHNVTRIVLDALASLGEIPLIVDVVVGAVYTHQAALECQLASLPHEVHLHINTNDMVGLMQLADVAISGAGSTCWELATIGVPTCTVTLAENQQAIAGE